MTTPTPAQIEAAGQAVYLYHQATVATFICKEVAKVAITAAAEVGERHLDDEIIKALDEAETLEARTIERCAQVADNYEWPNKPKYPSQPIRTVKTDIAAAIRALKDKP